MSVDLSRVSESDIESLTYEGKIELLSKVWRSLFGEPESVPISAEVMQLLDERLAEYDANPEACRPWEEVLADIRARR